MVKETRKMETEQDIYVIIPPVIRKIELFIGNIRKGKPVIVTPDDTTGQGCAEIIRIPKEDEG